MILLDDNRDKAERRKRDPGLAILDDNVVGQPHLVGRTGDIHLGGSDLLGQSGHGCLAGGSVINQVQGIFATGDVAESRRVDRRLVARDGEREGFFGRAGQLLQVPETLCRTKWAGGTEDAIAPKR